MTLILALSVLPACSSAPRAHSQEIFDEQTGNTLLVAARPLVFARTRTDVAAYARDYATLVAVEVDISGKFSDYLLLYRWSTVDPRMSPPPAQAQGELRILTEGRELDLKPLEQLPISLRKAQAAARPGSRGGRRARLQGRCGFAALHRLEPGTHAAHAAGAARHAVQNMGGRPPGARPVCRASRRTINASA